MSREKLCSVFKHSRQALWKHQKRLEKWKNQEEFILEKVREIRSHMPRTGTRKMLGAINHQLLLGGYEPIGRDKLFQVLRDNNMLVPPLKRTTRTTHSYHRFRVHKNLLKRTIQTAPNQAYASDITYLRLTTGFCYLFIITDIYSRKIVGYSLSKSLSVEGGVKALKMALKQCPNPEGVIHHSDRGIQYCCDAYTTILKAKKMAISMTEENHCYENAIAERVNGTLKYDLMLGETMPSFKIAQGATREAVKIYNEERWHQSLGYLTPAAKHAA